MQFGRGVGVGVCSALPISGEILREMGSCPFISVHFWDYQPETSYAHVGIHIQSTLFYRYYFCNVIMYLLISAKRTFLEVCKVSHIKQI